MQFWNGYSVEIVIKKFQWDTYMVYFAIYAVIYYSVLSVFLNVYYLC